MIDFTAMAISQQSHQEFQAIQLSTSSSLKFTDILIDHMYPKVFDTKYLSYYIDFLIQVYM